MSGKKKTDYELDFPFAEDELDLIPGNIIKEVKISEPQKATVNSTKDSIKETPNSKSSQPSVQSIAPVDLKSKSVSGTGYKGSLTVSLSNLSSKSFSQSDQVNPKSDSKESKNKKNFSLDELNYAVLEFANKMNEDGKLNLSSALMSNQPTLKDDYCIEITVASQALEQSVNENKVDFLEHLKSKLENDFISINIIVSESETESVAYTPSEKFKSMSQKNPALIKLKTDFDLELGF